MTSRRPGRHQAYRPVPWERACSVAAATVGLGVVLYLVVRDQPFSDPNFVVMTRIILSLSVAILGATVPGFLNVGWSAKGFAIRAGGALALFVLTFLLTPEVVQQETHGPNSPAISGVGGDVTITNAPAPGGSDR